MCNIYGYICSNVQEDLCVDLLFWDLWVSEISLPNSGFNRTFVSTEQVKNYFIL